MLMPVSCVAVVIVVQYVHALLRVCWVGQDVPNHPDLFNSSNPQFIPSCAMFEALHVII